MSNKYCKAINPFCNIISVWRYAELRFEVQQQLGEASYPMSFISLSLGTVAWHWHIRDTIEDRLRFVEKIKSVPFFLFNIIPRVWCMSDLVNTLRAIIKEKKLSILDTWFEENIYLATSASFAPIFVMFTCQMVFHKW